MRGWQLYICETGRRWSFVSDVVFFAANFVLCFCTLGALCTGEIWRLPFQDPGFCVALTLWVLLSGTGNTLWIIFSRENMKKTVAIRRGYMLFPKGWPFVAVLTFERICVPSSVTRKAARSRAFLALCGVGWWGWRVWVACGCCAHLSRQPAVTFPELQPPPTSTWRMRVSAGVLCLKGEWGKRRWGQ